MSKSVRFLAVVALLGAALTSQVQAVRHQVDLSSTGSPSDLSLPKSKSHAHELLAQVGSSLVQDMDKEEDPRATEKKIDLEKEQQLKRQVESQNVDHWTKYFEQNGGDDKDDADKEYFFDKETSHIRLKKASLAQGAKEGMAEFAEQKAERQKEIKSLEAQEVAIKEDIKRINQKLAVHHQQNTTYTLATTRKSDALDDPQSDNLQEELKKDQKNLTETHEKLNKTKKAKKFFHVIPHSHTDLGWLVTADEQYNTFDDDASFFQGDVKDILDSTFNELLGNENYTFTYAEMMYFHRWYQGLNKNLREDVADLVATGRLNLVNGGWSSPDEALTSYDYIIDNFMVGHQFLWEEFQFVPKISWQIDTFGVSTGYARLAKDFGFDVLYFSRLDIQEKMEQRKKKSRTQVWRPHEENFGKQKDILAVTMDHQSNSTIGPYCWPTGFWADTNYIHDAPIVFDKNNKTHYDFDQRVKHLFWEVSEHLKNERTQHVFKMFGCDMAFVDAKINYKIIDKLFEMWRQLGFDEEIEILMSSPEKFRESMQEVNFEMAIKRNKTLEDDPINLNTTFGQNASGLAGGKTLPKEPEAGPDDLTFPNGTTRPVSETATLKDVPYRHTGKPGGQAAQLSGQAGVDLDHVVLNQTRKHANLTKPSNTTLLHGLKNPYNKTQDKNLTTEDIGWPIRKDDSLPYAQDKWQYWSGFYSSRVYLKREIRLMITQFYSSLRLLSQQALRRDVAKERVDELLGFQDKVLKQLGLLVHHDSITGTAQYRAISDYYERAKKTRKAVNELNSELLLTRLQVDHGLVVGKGSLKQDMEYVETYDELSTSFAHQDEFAVVIQNPSLQVRREWVEIEVPYYNYTVWEVKNGTLEQFLDFDKYLPKLKFNSNTTIVKAYCGFKVSFDEPQQLSRAFVFKNLGVIRQVNPPPVDYQGVNPITNLNLPVFKQKNHDDINNFQSNFRKLRPGDTITVGSKSLQFIKVANSTTKRPTKAQLAAQKLDLLYKEGKSEVNSTTVKKEKQADANKYQPQKEAYANSTKNATELSAEKRLKGKKLPQGPEENEGAAIFLFKDSEKGISQKFSFNLRYYKSHNDDQKRAEGSRHDGHYELSVNNGTEKEVTSKPYAKILEKKLRKRQNRNSAEMVLHFEDQFIYWNGTEYARAAARIHMNDVEDFVKFTVTLNEVPVGESTNSGKNLVVDWGLMDGFDTKNKLYIDANGLEMIEKELYHRKEFPYHTNNTIAANYYPVTSALMVKDGGSDRQVVIMPDRPQGASAGLRNRRNIEMMMSRVLRRSDGHGNAESMMDMDANGRQLQIETTYLMQLSKAKSSDENTKSLQRAQQRKMDQPLLLYYTNQFDVDPTQSNSKILEVNNTNVLNNTERYYSHNFTASDNRSNSTNATNSTSNQTVAQPDATSKDKPTATPPKAEQPAGPTFRPALILDANGNMINGTRNLTRLENYTNEANISISENRDYKYSQTLKVQPYLKNQSELLLRVANLEDRFDSDPKTYKFDVNSWAREWYLEANAHLAYNESEFDVLKNLMVIVTEMNLSGVVSLDYLKFVQNQTNWLTNPALDPPLIQPPEDDEPVYQHHKALYDCQLNRTTEATHDVTLEPQRIRMFSVKFQEIKNPSQEEVKIACPERWNEPPHSTGTKPDPQRKSPYTIEEDDDKKKK